MSKANTVRVPQQARSIEKKKRLSVAAMQEFAANGYQGTTAKGIAKAAGVSVGTFYAYYPDKKALLMDILNQHMLEVDSSVFTEARRMIAKGATGREVIRRMVDLGHQAHTDSAALQRVMLAMRYSDEEVARNAEAAEEDMFSKVAAFLASLGDNVRITDMDAAARVISETYEAILHSVSMGIATLEKERLYDALADMVSHYVFQNPDSPIQNESEQ